MIDQLTDALGNSQQKLRASATEQYDLARTAGPETNRLLVDALQEHLRIAREEFSAVADRVPGTGDLSHWKDRLSELRAIQDAALKALADAWRPSVSALRASATGVVEEFANLREPAKV